MSVERIHDLIPRTSAYFKPRDTFQDPNVRYWLTSPRYVEKRFARTHGQWIVENYLDIFSEDMHNLHMEIIRNSPENNVFTFRGMLFHIKLFVNIGNLCVIMLKEVYIRPCAANLKLFKIILLHLTRICVAYHCDFYVECPLKVTEAVIKKAFGPLSDRQGQAAAQSIIKNTSEVIPQLGPRDDSRSQYMIMRHSNLMELDLAECFELKEAQLLLPISFEQPESWIIPPIVCNPDYFPYFDIMNFGPAPHRRADFVPPTVIPRQYKPIIHHLNSIKLLRRQRINIIDEMYVGTSLMTSDSAMMVSTQKNKEFEDSLRKSKEREDSLMARSRHDG